MAEIKTTELGQMLVELARAGLADQVGSWISDDTDNSPVTGEQLRSALPEEVLREAAEEAGMTVEELADQLARELPTIADALTPGGELPGGD
ncbi:hypothetical protein DZF91_02045 [Actinomadura logoneensis]|uniref:DUF937 domain-containing protein n=1 Tax=Actinomadura logoneensis TaxID=2293572 RepID=A0A372JTA3_9ACTN|nr:YidB family protein [Actinomadura logoneensis]RFU43252.1 hypothetical protein DZF91_02045 [Actinomadura logoneensis]